MRKLIYYVATSLDGLIARPDGSFADFPYDDAYGAELYRRYPETIPPHLTGQQIDKSDHRQFDAVLMGRATYEAGLKDGVSSPYPSLDQYVFSTTMQETPDEEVTLVQEDAVDRVADLKKEDGRDIWLCGGGKLAGDLLSAKLIDEMIVKLNPVLLGDGIPMFVGHTNPTRLETISFESFDSGHQLIHHKLGY